jgi:hypothetical protein
MNPALPRTLSTFTFDSVGGGLSIGTYNVTLSDSNNTNIVSPSTFNVSARITTFNPTLVTTFNTAISGISVTFTANVPSLSYVTFAAFREKTTGVEYQLTPTSVSGKVVSFSNLVGGLASGTYRMKIVDSFGFTMISDDETVGAASFDNINLNGPSMPFANNEVIMVNTGGQNRIGPAIAGFGRTSGWSTFNLPTPWFLTVKFNQISSYSSAIPVIQLYQDNNPPVDGVVAMGGAPYNNFPTLTFLSINMAFYSLSSGDSTTQNFAGKFAFANTEGSVATFGYDGAYIYTGTTNRVIDCVKTPQPFRVNRFAPCVTGAGTVRMQLVPTIL